MKRKLKRDCEASCNRDRMLLLYNEMICLSTMPGRNQIKMIVRYGSSDSKSAVVGLVQHVNVQYHYDAELLA